jgi:phosphatidylglycerol:prolipoprotein diacylglycerol transferase
MPGAIIGGVLGIYIFARRNKIEIGTLLDAAAPGIALAQAIGRWGNRNRIPEYAAFERFHPLFLYESIWNLLSMFFLLWIWRRFDDRLKSGDLFFVYLITYPVGRFLLEFIRLDYVPLFGINFNQGFMFLIAIASGLVLFLRHRKKSEA